MNAQQHLDRLMRDMPQLEALRPAIEQAYTLIRDCFQRGGKLLLCGNGGSACDCEHIAGELMKGFLLKRPLTESEKEALDILGEDGEFLATHLQRALPTLVLSGLTGLTTAFLNDVDGEAAYAQQAFGYAAPGDVFIGITTSGNARNVRLAALSAKARGARIIGMTGMGGGRLAEHCDALINVPEMQTYRIQELHLPIYHALCAMIEAEMFGEDE